MGQISEHTVEGYFWVFNLVESKNSLVGFSGSKDFIVFVVHITIVLVIYKFLKNSNSLLSF